ncbi:hypothetical protein ACFL27_24265 [candidate division CSSED10-310 bacterium]|uniref:DUF3108 domain-containing protein n=1 Tax=candidate division CSSED10-310 bacterium TaxID=2855610 RepID=A0ABV6Z4F6_UNCC1
MKIRRTPEGKTLLILVFLILLCGIVSCPSDDDDDDNNGSAYFPSQDGNQWIYQTTYYDDSTSEITQKISGTKNFANVNCQIMIETETTEPGEEQRRYFVDSGSAISIYGYEDYENGTLVETYISPQPMKFFVYPLTVGQTWDVINLTNVAPSTIWPDSTDDVDGDGTPDTMDFKMTATVKEEATVTVPAGSFNSFKIEYHNKMTIHMSSSGQDFVMEWIQQHSWMGPNIGIVQEINYEDDESEIVMTSKLKEYHLGN